MKKKILALILIGVLSVFPLSQVAHAADPVLTNSTGSDSTDRTKGADTTQGKVTEYEPAVTINSTTSSTTQAVSVYATKTSMLMIESPKTLVLDATSNSLTYQIGLKGDLSGRQTLAVTIPNTVTLKDGTKTATANLTALDKASFVWSDLNSATYIYKTGTINCPTLTAGRWSGAFNIQYNLTMTP